MKKIKVTPFIQDTILLVNGRKRRKVKYKVYIDTIIKDYAKKAAVVLKAQEKAISDRTEDAYSDLGNAVIAFFEVCFGEPATKEIIDFYENKPLTMLHDLDPYIANNILPLLNNIDAIIKESRQKRS